GNVMRCALALDRGAECEDDFLDGRIARALYQRADGKVVRPDSVKRRQDSTQYVIARIDSMRALERPKIGDVRHHHDGRIISPQIGAQRARILRVDIAADSAN